MSIATASRTQDALGERRFLIYNVGWQGYLKLLQVFEQGGPRITYDRGTVELMSPLMRHERPNRLLQYVVDAICDEFDIPRVNAGSTTFKAEFLNRGLESDTCYYLPNAHRLRHYNDEHRMDLAIDPLPDLAIEVEITSALIDKLPIYAALSIPEIWRHDGKALQVLLLGPEGTYAPSETSASFPFVPMADVARLIDEHDGTNDTRWMRTVRQWVREVVAPRFPG